MATAGCLDELELMELADGSCSAAARVERCAHLDGCATCRTVLAELLGEEGATTVLQRPRVAEARDATAPSGDTPELRLPSVHGGYRFTQLLAEGGMGRIYRARDLELGREVAIKVPRSSHRSLVARFDLEVALSARLTHPGLVPVHGAGTLANGTRFYVMRYVEGEGLDVAVARASNRTARLALVRHVLAVAETMAFVHAMHITHRDLKPNNVLLSKFGETLIIDWGLAIEGDEGDEPIAETMPALAPGRLTQTGAVLGTPGFMPPEQVAGERVDLRADVYAIGAILRYVVSGGQRLSARDAGSDADFPRPLVAIWNRALAPAKSDRFANAGELAAALRDAIAEIDTKPRPARSWYRRPAILIGTAAVGLAVAGLAMVLRSRPRGTISLVPHGSLPPQTRAIAVSPSGSRVAYATLERVEARDLGTDERWSRVGWTQAPAIVQFTGESVVELAVAGERDAARRHVSWEFVRDTTSFLDAPALDGIWLGRFKPGDVIARASATQPVLVTPTGTRTLPAQGREPITIASASPTLARFAYVDPAGAHSAVIHVIETDGAVHSSSRIDDLTGVAWLADDTVVYGVGALGRTRVFRVRVGEHGIGAPTLLYTDPSPARTLSAFAAGGGRLFALVSTTTSESRLVDRETNASTMLGSAAVSIVLAWRDERSFYSWDSATGKVELRSIDEKALPRLTGSRVDGDPISATRAGEILIVAIRSAAGRRLEAHVLGEATPRWQREPGQLSFVRCAGDAHEPCVAGVEGPDGDVELRRIAPATGELGPILVPAGPLADAAIDDTGQQLALIVGATIVTRGLDGGSEQRSDQLALPRSVAFDPRGGLVVVASNDVIPQVFRLHDDKLRSLASHPGSFISLIRPSPRGGHLAYRVRAYTTELAELRGAK